MKICPIMSKVMKEEDCLKGGKWAELGSSYIKLNRIKCLKEECALWITKQIATTYNYSKDGYCGLIKT